MWGKLYKKIKVEIERHVILKFVAKCNQQYPNAIWNEGIAGTIIFNGIRVIPVSLFITKGIELHALWIRICENRMRM